ncbi:ABC transporter permease [Frankia sp. AgPm24]|uniref:ABC transporter permease n=1 Tax=Frankia sp. AgPm24 TaxID=631128 RepID=UPI00200F596E|nr:ABC transporter permease [Frankia sp. AgPm24]MCK9923029.1 ABC transporter permease [Frankia sp. AgPm24]
MTAAEAPTTVKAATTVATADSGPRLADTVRSEWVKLAARRSTYVILGTGFVLAIAVTALVAVAVGATWEHWSAEDRADFDPVIYSSLGLILSGILAVLLAIRVVSSEYPSAMIRWTLAATPKRERVFAAKMIVAAFVTAAAGLVTSLAAFGTGQLVFGAYDLPTVGLTDEVALRALLVGALVTPVYPLIGAALAVLARSAVVPLTGVLVLLFAPAVIAAFLPESWRTVLYYTPGPASDSLSFAHPPDASSQLGVATAVLVIVVWLAIPLGAAGIRFARRDA